MRCVVTGASGLVGRALVDALKGNGHWVDCWVHGPGFDLDAGVPGAVESDPAWQQRLAGVDVVVHLAAKVHQRKGASGPEDYLRVNRDGTLRLAASAAAAGVRRFVFLSTVKVFGEGRGAPYTLGCAPRPEDPYAESKWQAERGLLALAERNRLEVVIIRPPLVYGPGVGANFRALWRLAALPLPLPLAAVRNRRDMVSVDNLVDLICTTADHPAAVGRTLLCSDGRAYSLAELIAAMRVARGRRPGLFAVPRKLLFSLLAGLRGEADARRLLGDFQVDITESCRLLDWSPRFRLEDTLRRMAADEISS